jgi:hypothetical protein
MYTKTSPIVFFYMIETPKACIKYMHHIVQVPENIHFKFVNIKLVRAQFNIIILWTQDLSIISFSDDLLLLYRSLTISYYYIVLWRSLIIISFSDDLLLLYRSLTISYYYIVLWRSVIIISFSDDLLLLYRSLTI